MELELERDGWQWRSIPLDGPRVGGVVTFRTPGIVRVRPVLVTAVLATDANVSTRRLAVQLTDAGGNTTALLPAPGTQTAGLFGTYTFGVGLQPIGGNNAAIQVAPLPELELEQGGTLALVVVGALAGDQLLQASLYVAQRPRFEAE